MFSHLSLRPSSADSQTSPPFLKDIGEKLSGSAGTLADDMMAKSKSGAEAAKNGSTSSDDVSTSKRRDKMSSGQSAEVYPPSGKESGKVRAFDPITETGMIMANGNSIHGTIPFDTEGMSAELERALKEGERGMAVTFKATTVSDEWMATEIEEVSPPQSQGSQGTGGTHGDTAASFSGHR